MRLHGAVIVIPTKEGSSGARQPGRQASAKPRTGGASKSLELRQGLRARSLDFARDDNFSTRTIDCMELDAVEQLRRRLRRKPSAEKYFETKIRATSAFAFDLRIPQR
jgi:hypothetical protein